MHQTTIRFGSELWRRIDEESSRIGVSAAQYIRDSTLIRLTTDAATAAMPVGEVQPGVATAITAAEEITTESQEITTESQAVWAQARLARERSRGLRDTARRLAEMRASQRSGTNKGAGDE